MLDGLEAEIQDFVRGVKILKILNLGAMIAKITPLPTTPRNVFWSRKGMEQSLDTDLIGFCFFNT